MKGYKVYDENSDMYDDIPDALHANSGSQAAWTTKVEECGLQNKRSGVERVQRTSSPDMLKCITSLAKMQTKKVGLHPSTLRKGF